MLQKIYPGKASNSRLHYPEAQQDPGMGVPVSDPVICRFPLRSQGQPLPGYSVVSASYGPVQGGADRSGTHLHA